MKMYALTEHKCPCLLSFMRVMKYALTLLRMHKYLIYRHFSSNVARVPPMRYLSGSFAEGEN